MQISLDTLYFRCYINVNKIMYKMLWRGLVQNSIYFRKLLVDVKQYKSILELTSKRLSEIYIFIENRHRRHPTVIKERYQYQWYLYQWEYSCDIKHSHDYEIRVVPRKAKYTCLPSLFCRLLCNFTVEMEGFFYCKK